MMAWPAGRGAIQPVVNSPGRQALVRLWTERTSSTRHARNATHPSSLSYSSSPSSSLTLILSCSPFCSCSSSFFSSSSSSSTTPYLPQSLPPQLPPLQLPPSSPPLPLTISTLSPPPAPCPSQLIQRMEENRQMTKNWR